MVSGAWICLLSPLVSAGLITLGGTRLSRRASGYVATLSCFVAFGGALASFIGLLGREGSQRQLVSTAWTWVTGGSYRSGLEVMIDPLSVFMMLVVAGVGALIVGYSIGYMDGDDEERRYFAYMSIFVFSMLLLVQGGNLILLLAGWGMVGLSSYLLIGFWHERPSAIAAAKKAFVMNAIGDATMALAFFLLIQHTGTLSFGALTAVHGSSIANLVALGLLGGAVAKSAQLPLQTWLPDAMEGPTPVSALIHAATMVTAGVYLIVRSLALFGIFPFAGFFSKDSILAAAMDHGAYGYVLWVAGLAGTFLTGLYTFRMFFLVFWGEPSAFVREHFHALRRDVVGVSMASTVAVLAVLSVMGGWLQFAPLWHPVETWLQTVAEPVVSPTSWQEAISSALAFVLGLAGIAAAWLVYGTRRVAVPRLAFAQRTFERKFYFDEVYDALFYAPSAWIARLLGRAVEQPLIAETGPDIANDTRQIGGLVARAQTGLLRTYALAIASSVAVLATVFVAVK